MERDDLIVNESYALNAKHDEATGKQIRKKLYAVTVLLTVITIIEVSKETEHSLGKQSN
jgi:hypothetical protein